MGLRDSLPSFLNHPYYVLLVTVVGLVSLPLSIYFYVASQETRDLVFTVDPSRTVIARAGRPSELRVEFKGEAIKSDVIGTQIALWNQGRKSIHASDVLTPLQIRLNPPSPILQVSVAKTSRSVIALAVVNDAEMLRQGRIPVTFRILENNDGGNIQIIYAGGSGVGISLVGEVEAMGSPRNPPATVLTPPPFSSYGDRLFARVFPWLWVLWLFVVPIPGMIKHLRHRDHPRSIVDKVILATDCLMFGAAIAMGFFVFKMFRYVPTPPFGY